MLPTCAPYPGVSIVPVRAGLLLLCGRARPPREAFSARALSCELGKEKAVRETQPRALSWERKCSAPWPPSLEFPARERCPGGGMKQSRRKAAPEAKAAACSPRSSSAGAKQRALLPGTEGARWKEVFLSPAVTPLLSPCPRMWPQAQQRTEPWGQICRKPLLTGTAKPSNGFVPKTKESPTSKQFVGSGLLPALFGPIFGS